MGVLAVDYRSMGGVRQERWGKGQNLSATYAVSAHDLEENGMQEECRR